jgi:hypothetical protein
VSEEADSQRRPWIEGPEDDASAESWLALDDDGLLHRIETLDPEENHDDRLLEVVGSNRHFFIRQEAAKRVHERNRLFYFEDDRHVGQILVRYLNRREDVTYLERLCALSTHKEVRSAAQVQLARLWRRLALHAPVTPTPPRYESDTSPLPQLKAGAERAAAATRDAASPASAAAATAAAGIPPGAASGPLTPVAVTPVSMAAAAAPPARGGEPIAPAAAPSPAAAPPADAAPPASLSLEPITSAAVERGGVDGSLLAWAAHFLVQPLWTHLGTRGTRDLLTQTRRALIGRHPTLVFFEITPDAYVATNLESGPRLPREAVEAVAAWMVAFRHAVRVASPATEIPSMRSATAMMADALRDAGFYAAFDALEAAGRG